MTDNYMNMQPINPNFKKPPQYALDFEKTPAFDAFTDKLLEEAKAGVPISNLIANAVMVLFRPSFVIIGSGYLEKTPAGYSFPESIGIALASDKDFTPVDLVAVLSMLVDKYTEAVDNQFEVPNE